MAEMTVPSPLDTDYVTVRELNQQTGEVLRRVEAGETLAVTKNGHPVALLTPLPRHRLDRLIATGQARPVRGEFEPLPLPTEKGRKTVAEHLAEDREER